MANRNSATATVEAPARTEPITLNPEDSRNVLAAWRPLHELLGARVESWDISADQEQIIANGLTFPANLGETPEKIVKDISGKDRRVALFPAYNYLQGKAPEAYSDSAAITLDMVQYWKGAVQEGTARAPEYLRNAAANYKKQHNFENKRGAKPRVIRLDKLDELNPEQIGKMDLKKLQALKALLENIKMDETSDETEAEAVNA